MASGTNPDTCLHNFIAAGFDIKLKPHVWCICCNGELSEDDIVWARNHYEYDHTNRSVNVWGRITGHETLRARRRRMERPQTRVDANG